MGMMMINWAIVGLGNPGMQYAQNRHNIGFMVLDVLQDRLGCAGFKIKQNIAITDCVVNTLDNKNNNIQHRLFLIKPQTFMNLSGRGVSPVLSFYKIPLDNVIVFHDELDLEPGRVKIKCGGGHGGHNGLKSLDSCIGADYWRVRLGIGHPGHKDAVSGYVLCNFRPNEIDQWVMPCVEAVSSTVEEFLPQKNAVHWMNAIQQRMRS